MHDIFFFLMKMFVFWGVKEIKDTFLNRKTLHIVDSCPYFFDNIERIGDEDYDPSEEDLLQARIPPSGILEQSFPIKNNTFKIYDVGGQRSERNKWILKKKKKSKKIKKSNPLFVV